jgi:hypothetical protein
MSYNPFRWFTKVKKKRLPQSAHLFDKIVNGDFNYSYYHTEAEEARIRANSTFEKVMKETGTYAMARQAARMDNIRAMKLDEEAHKDEFRLLKELRDELCSKFGFDLWDSIMESDPMDTEEVYDFYCQEKMRRRGLDI